MLATDRDDLRRGGVRAGQGFGHAGRAMAGGHPHDDGVGDLTCGALTGDGDGAHVPEASARDQAVMCSASKISNVARDRFSV